MKKSDLFKQQRSQKLDAQAAILDKCKAENREMNAAEVLSFDALDVESTELEGQIARALKAEKIELEIASRAAGAVLPAGGGEEKELDKIQKRFSIVKAIRDAHPGKQLSGVEKEIHEMGLAESRAAGVTTDTDTGFSMPISMLRASQQTVSQDSGAFGGTLVQNGAPIIVDPLRPRLFLEALGASFITGLSGGDIPLIVASDFAMEFLAEGAALTPTKKQYAGPSLNPKRAGGAVDISNRLIMQSSVDVEALIMTGLRNGFSQLLESASINGAGGNAPTGLLSYAGVLASTTTASAAATFALIVELQSLIEENDATEQSLGYLMHPKLKAFLKQLKKDAGSGMFLFQDNMLDGYNAVATSLMPKLNSNANFPLIFGDFSQMTIGQWGAINIKVNPYSADLSDSVRLTLNTHADMQIANAKAFAKNAFLTA